MFRGHRYICQPQITSQDSNQPDQMDPRRGFGAGNADFEEGEERVEPVFGDVGPGFEGGGEPARGD